MIIEIRDNKSIPPVLVFQSKKLSSILLQKKEKLGAVLKHSGFHSY